MPCILDKFSWVIFDTIFDYLKTTDLLHAFVNISPYIDNVLHSYSRIQLNFKSMKKSTFYFVCEHVHPDQIQSLVLSDDEYTPGQMKLFMSLLPLIKFINLQHITIDQIDDVNLLSLIISHLENNTRLRSLSVNSKSIEINKKDSRQIAEILTTLPSLKYLTFINSSVLATLRQPLLKLTHLTINACNLNDLKILFHRIPNLVYLKMVVPYHDATLTADHVLSHLNSLIIESQNLISFDQLENFFSLTPSLKHLTLETMGEQAMLDGRRWETLIETKLPNLTEFALNLTPEENDLTADDVLTHFQTSFWTTDKHWQMACLISTMTETCVQLFSVPRFSPNESWYPLSEGFLNRSLNNYIFYESCTYLRVSDLPSEVAVPIFFKNVRTLSLGCTIDNIEQLEKLVNLSSVNHLRFENSVECKHFHDLLKSAPKINQLKMDQKTLVQIIDSLPDDQKVYEQIKKLNIEDTILQNNIDQICQMFPKLEHVCLSVKERDDIVPIFNGLHHLTSAAVNWTHPTNTSTSIIDEYVKQNDICTDGTYRFHASSLHVWVD